MSDEARYKFDGGQVVDTWTDTAVEEVDGVDVGEVGERAGDIIAGLLNKVNVNECARAREVSRSMFVKLVPLDRVTGRPVACPTRTPVVLSADPTMLDAVLSLVGMGGMGAAHTADMLAQLLSEMFGADVFYWIGSGGDKPQYVQGYLETDGDRLRRFKGKLSREVERSIRLHPGGADMHGALLREAEELRAAMESGVKWREEALQCAAVALRIAMDGDADYPATQPKARPADAPPAEGVM
jgi:hypothetical protein